MDKREPMAERPGAAGEAAGEVWEQAGEPEQAAEKVDEAAAAVPAEDTHGAEDEAAAREAEWRRRLEAYAAKAAFSEARAAAAALGVPENRLDYAARLANAADIDPEQPGAREAIAAAVQRVLTDVPELRGGAGTGQNRGARRFRRDAFERGFMGD